MEFAKRKTIVVTGASSGIGKATMKLLISNGHRVIATARRTDDIAAICAAGAEPFELELSSEKSIVDCAAEVCSVTEHIDALFNNAGYGFQVAMEDASFEKMQHQMLVNVIGPSAFTNLLLHRVPAGGQVIFNSSILGRLVLPFRGPYCSSKFAIEAVADAYRLELRSRGIRVHVIEPGPVVANFRQNALRVLSDCLANKTSCLDYSRHRGRLEAALPSAGAVTAEYVAQVIVDIVEGRNESKRVLIGRPAMMSAALKWLLGSGFDYVARKTEPVEVLATASTHPPYTNP